MTADVPGDFSNSIQNHFLSFSLNYFPLCFVLFYCSTSVLIVFFLCRRRLVQMRNGMNLLLSLSLFLHSLSFTVPFPVLRFAHLQPPVTMSKVFSPFPEPSEEWTEVKILGLSQTHTTQSLKERNNFFVTTAEIIGISEKNTKFSHIRLQPEESFGRNIQSTSFVQER